MLRCALTAARCDLRDPGLGGSWVSATCFVASAPPLGYLWLFSFVLLMTRAAHCTQAALVIRPEHYCPTVAVWVCFVCSCCCLVVSLCFVLFVFK